MAGEVRKKAVNQFRLETSVISMAGKGRKPDRELGNDKSLQGSKKES